MIRMSMFFTLAALAACRPAASDDESEEAGGKVGSVEMSRGPIATVSVEGGPGDCRFRWNGEPATRLDLGTRAAAAVDRAITAHGGIESLGEEDLPYAILEAPAGQVYDCMAQAVEDLRQAGVFWADLRIAGKGDDRRVRFEVPGMAEHSALARLAVEPDGRLLWNGEEIEPAELPGLGRRYAGDPGGIVVVPAAGAALENIYDIVEAISGLTLAGCESDDIPEAPSTVSIPPPVQQVPIPGRRSTQSRSAERPPC